MATFLGALLHFFFSTTPQCRSDNCNLECWNIDLNMKQALSDIVMKSHFKNTMFHNTAKTEACHGNVPQVLFFARTTMAK